MLTPDSRGIVNSRLAFLCEEASVYKYDPTFDEHWSYRASEARALAIAKRGQTTRGIKKSKLRETHSRLTQAD